MKIKCLHLFRRLRSANYRHWICLVLLLASSALTAFRYRNRIYNLYGTCILTVETKDGTMDELHGQHSYFIRDMETLSSKAPPQTEPPKKARETVLTNRRTWGV